MNFGVGHEDIFETVLERFGRLPSDLKSEISLIQNLGDLEELYEDLLECESLADLRRAVVWFQGVRCGRIKATRDAVFLLIGNDLDAVTDRIEERAFHTSDPAELEQLLLMAAHYTRSLIFSSVQGSWGPARNLS